MKKLSIASLILFLNLVVVSCGGGGGGGGNTNPVPIPPSITSFTASTTAPSAGQSVVLTAVFSNGTGTIVPVVAGVSGAAQAILSSVGITVNPNATTIYNLTVTNSAGSSATATLTLTVAAASRSLTYTDPTAGTYRFVRNASLSTSTHLVLDLVTTDTQLVSGIGFSLTYDATKLTATKVNSTDAYEIQNGPLFNLGTGTPVLYAKLMATNTNVATFTYALAQKGATGLSMGSAVLLRIAFDPYTGTGLGTIGTSNFTITKAKANVQGTTAPVAITITPGTLVVN